MPRWFKRKKEKLDDKVISKGIVFKEIPSTPVEPDWIPVGAKLDFARIVRTPMGISMRIAHSKRWIYEDFIKWNYNPDLVFDYTGTNSLEKTPNERYKTKSSVRIKGRRRASIINMDFDIKNSLPDKNKKKKFKSVKKYTIHDNITKNRLGACGMKKNDLRSALLTLSPGDVITLKFLETDGIHTGEYEVLALRKGRGKGGSQMVDLKSSDGTTFTTGTPDSDKILHIMMPDGRVHGYATEGDVPVVFEVNTERSLSFKEDFLAFYDAGEPDGTTIHVESLDPSFAGTFKLVSARRTRGRYGEVVLSLKRPTGEIFELWSRRHSGVVTSCMVFYAQTPIAGEAISFEEGVSDSSDRRAVVSV